MVRRLFFLFLGFLAFIYLASGIYFYNKSLRIRKQVAVKQKPVEVDSTTLVLLKDFYNDFESDNSPAISNEKFFSGKKSYKFTPEMEYGTRVATLLSEIPSWNTLKCLDVSMKLLTNNIKEHILCVVEIDGEDGKVALWVSDLLPDTKGEWQDYKFHFNIDSKLISNFSRVVVYPWNDKKNTFYIDDLSVKYSGWKSIIREEHKYAPLKQTTYYFDLENNSGLDNKKSLSEDIAHSGKKSSLMKSKNDYSVIIKMPLDSVFNDTITTINTSAWIYPSVQNPYCVIGFQINSKEHEQIVWMGKSTDYMNLKPNQWQKINAAFKLSPEVYRTLDPEDELEVFVYNTKSNKVYIDDFEITYGNMPSKRGGQLFVDMNVLPERNYSYSRLHPPYPFVKLNATDIGNNNSKFLIDNGILKSGELFNARSIYTGNFLQPGIKEELLVQFENEIFIFSYCPSLKRFIISGKVQTGLLDGKCYPGDYNDDGKDDLLVISRGTGKVITFDQKQRKSCMDDTNEINAKVIWNGTIPGENFIAGKFLNGMKTAILAIDHGNYKLMQFQKTGWKTLHEGVLPEDVFDKKSKLVCGRFFSHDKDEILSAYIKNQVMTYSVIRFEDNKIQKTNINYNIFSENIFSKEDTLMCIRSSKNKPDDILAFNNKWRFNLRFIQPEENAVYISSVPEFTGYPADQNPKYYEYPKIITGNFTGQGNELIFILYNCKDANFDGHHCVEAENVSDLPNRIQLYSMGK